jgi:DNA repair photolyase
MSRVWNPPNRFHPVELDWEEPPPPARLELVEDHSRSILSRNQSPDVGFEWSVNAYRGCTHSCAYCYARPYHEYLGLGAGTDHDRIIHYKPAAAALLRQHFEEPHWKGELVAFSGVTDCYQPLERRLGLTRACLEVCRDYKNPVSIITRSPLVTRDIDLLGPLAELGAARVHVSIPILDAELARRLEPGAPPPQARLRALSALSAAGVPVGLSLSPIIPGLNDRQIPAILQAAREAGAVWAWMLLLRLPGAVASVFEARLREQLPMAADSLLARLQRSRGGSLSNPRFGERMKGQDETWAVTEQLFALWKERLGYAEPPARGPSPFQRPNEQRQLRLFGGA